MKIELMKSCAMECLRVAILSERPFVLRLA
jgi:hypothetical protein